MKRIVILISGRGSNMVAILDAVAAGMLPVQVAAVISNRPDAAGLAEAGDRVVVVAGAPVGISGTTNSLFVHKIGDLYDIKGGNL